MDGLLRPSALTSLLDFHSTIDFLSAFATLLEEQVLTDSGLATRTLWHLALVVKHVADRSGQNQPIN